MLRGDDLDEAKETAETKGELGERAVTSCKACKTYTDGPQLIQRSAWRKHLRAAPRKGNASGGLASVGDLAESKTKRKRQGREHRSTLALARWIFDRSANRRNRTVRRPAVKLQDNLAKPNVWYNGDIKKNPHNVGST